MVQGRVICTRAVPFRPICHYLSFLHIQRPAAPSPCCQPLPVSTHGFIADSRSFPTLFGCRIPKPFPVPPHVHATLLMNTPCAPQPALPVPPPPVYRPTPAPPRYHTTLTLHTPFEPTHKEMHRVTCAAPDDLPT